MISALPAQMDRMLEEEKREWTIEVARRRSAGYAVPQNPLTDEAYVAQAAAHLDRVIRAGTHLHEQDRVYQKSQDHRREIAVRIINELRKQPHLTARSLARLLNETEYTVYSCVNALVKSGVISRAHRAAPWPIDESRILILG